MTTHKNHPVDTIRDGSLKATIWKNTTEKGNFYSVNLTRSYKGEDGNWNETDSFSGSELLRVARLAEIAYSEILIRRGNDKAQAKGGES